MGNTLSTGWSLSDAYADYCLWMVKQERDKSEAETYDEPQPEIYSSLIVEIENYVAELRIPNTWLALVERRINDSIMPSSAKDTPSEEWLSPEAGGAALSFFRNACDLLPGEPHIYGTGDGDLIAEFETSRARLTSIVARNCTILFGYRSDADDAPTEIEIRKGSNRLRDEVREFMDHLGLGKDGKALATETR